MTVVYQTLLDLLEAKEKTDLRIGERVDVLPLTCCIPEAQLHQLLINVDIMNIILKDGRLTTELVSIPSN